MMMRKVMVVSLFSMLLAACGGDAGQILGLQKKAPDEFTVVKRAPLSLPPDFGLRPPQPGAKRAQETSARDAAQETLYGQRQARKQRVAELSRSDDAGLLAAVGAADADPNIRTVVTEEANAIILEESGFVNDLLFWREDEQPGVIVDASEETRRLQENVALGREVTEGETPMIRRKEGDDLFSDLDLAWPF